MKRNFSLPVTAFLFSPRWKEPRGGLVRVRMQRSEGEGGFVLGVWRLLPGLLVEPGEGRRDRCAGYGHVAGNSPERGGGGVDGKVEVGPGQRGSQRSNYFFFLPFFLYFLFSFIHSLTPFSVEVYRAYSIYIHWYGDEVEGLKFDRSRITFFLSFLFFVFFFNFFPLLFLLLCVGRSDQSVIPILRIKLLLYGETVSRSLDFLDGTTWRRDGDHN